MSSFAESPCTYEALQTSLPMFNSPDLNIPKFSPTSLIDFHLLENPGYPFGVMPGFSTNFPNDMITWNEVGSALIKVAQDLHQIVKLDAATAPVIGILASSDPLVYFTMLLAIMRAGCVPFAISPRNSPAAIVHLLKSTACSTLYVQFDPTLSSYDVEKVSVGEMRSRKQLTEVLESEDLRALKLLELPSAHILFPRLVDGSIYSFNHHLAQQLASIVTPEKPYDSPVMILHSSGTTAFPKPIQLTRFTFQVWMTASHYSRFPWRGQVLASMVLPAFHAMGIHFGLITVLSDGAVSGFFRPELGTDGRCMTKSPNSLNVIETMRSLGCTVAAFSPMMLAEYASDPSSVEFLRSLKRVGFGGGPLTVGIGNKLIEEGVQLSAMYGSTEVGLIATLFPEQCFGSNWEYFDISPQLTTRLIPHGEDLYELVILSSDRHRCSLTQASNGLGPQTYHTNDLLAKHPTLPLYRIVGRMDDQIMLSNSEKTNPGPLEAILVFHPAIKGALMFGRGKPQNGVLIEPEDGYAVDVTDRVAVDNYIDLIWPSVEEVNNFAPSHSRLTRELILVIDPRTDPLPKTSKGQVARVKTLEMFTAKIEDIYSRDLLSTDPGNFIIDSQGHVVVDKVLKCVREIVKEASKLDVKDEEDFFVQGCDSLSALRIKSRISQLATMNSKRELAVPQNIVYQHPSVSRLSDWLLGILSKRKSSEESEAFRCAFLRSMIAKYAPRTPAIRSAGREEHSIQPSSQSRTLPTIMTPGPPGNENPGATLLPPIFPLQSTSPNSVTCFRWQISQYTETGLFHKPLIKSEGIYELKSENWIGEIPSVSN